MSARVCFRSTDSDCFSGVCRKDCSHRMWVCDTCRCEGGWGASVTQLQEWADAHECPPVSAHEMTDEYTPTTDQVRFAAETSTFPESALTDGAFDRWLNAERARVAARAVRDAVRYARPDAGDRAGMTRSEAEAFEDALTLVEEYAAHLLGEGS